MLGKLSPADLAEVLAGTGAADDDVLVGPAYGEDAAAVDLGDRTLVVSTDPLSLAAERVGTLGVNVACNDVAASGARPRWLTNALFLPDDDPDVLDAVVAQVDDAASDLGVALVGGHSEYAPERDRPLLVLTAFGVTDEFVPTGGASPGDALVLTKGAGIEATAILATDFRDDLTGRVPEETLDRAARFFDDVGVVDEALAVRDYASAMHDPTEGGLVDGLFELASASDVTVEVAREDVPVRPETAACCDAMGVDPLKTFGSGALVAAVPEAEADEAVAAARQVGVDAAVVGRCVEPGDAPLVLDGYPVEEPVRDELYALWG